MLAAVPCRAVSCNTFSLRKIEQYSLLIRHDLQHILSTSTTDHTVALAMISTASHLRSRRHRRGGSCQALLNESVVEHKQSQIPKDLFLNDGTSHGCTNVAGTDRAVLSQPLLKYSVLLSRRFRLLCVFLPSVLLGLGR